jgi:hypothetical protein
LRDLGVKLAISLDVFRVDFFNLPVAVEGAEFPEQEVEFGVEESLLGAELHL